MTDESKTEARTPEAPPIVLRYVGNGDHFAGVPARDLTAADLEALDDDTKTALTTSGAYEENSDD